MNDTVQTEATEAVAKKSIVPAKYSGKYKGAGDQVAEFINKACSGTDGKFQFEAFFELCKINGIDEAKVKHYSDQVFVENRHGAKGRARMTLGNMLRSLAGKNGGLLGLDKEKVELVVEKRAVTGAAAAAQTAAAETQETAAEATTEDSASEADASADAGSEDTE